MLIKSRFLLWKDSPVAFILFIPGKFILKVDWKSISLSLIVVWNNIPPMFIRQAIFLLKVKH